jgi:hypothetical protein
MARLSQSLLANLGRPAYQESMFGLGQAIGGLGSQRREQQQKQEVNKLLQQIQGAQGSGDFNSMKILSQQLATIDPQQAAQVMQAATNLEQKQGQQKALEGLFTGEAQTPEAYMTAGQQALAAGDLKTALALREKATALGSDIRQKEAKRKAAVTQLQGFMQDPRVSQEDKLQVRGVLQGLVTGQTDVETVEPQLQGFRDRFKPKAVGSRAAPQKVEVMEKQPDGSMKKVTKFAIQDPVTGGLTYETVGLTPPKEFAPKDEVTKGDIAQSARKQWGNIMEQSSKASTSIIRTNDLIQKIQAEPDKATGLISVARTAILDTLGLRDAEEVNKTAALRQINSKIVGDLPPGVASDRDIAIFSQGFPTGNASSQEILEYLQIEARFLAIAQDKGILAEQFLENQMTKGQDATFVGFLERQQAYSTGLSMLEQKIQEEVSRGVDPVQAQTTMVQQFKQAFGFVPSFYR